MSEIEAVIGQEAEAFTTPLEPEARRLHEAIVGTPTVLGNGHEWLLAGHVPHLGDVWDDLYDANVVRGQYKAEDVYLAAVRLLLANYDLAPDEAAALILGTEPAALVPAVERALFGPDGRRHWSEWVWGALFVNRIDPDTIPPGKLNLVLEQLVANGDAIAPADFISSAKWAEKKARMGSAI